MIIYNNTMLWFAHDPSKRFEKELYKYWKSNIDFNLIENNLLVHLYESGNNYFTLPADKSTSNSDVYFLFYTMTDVPDTRMKHIRYDYKKRLFIRPDKIGLSK